MTHLFLSFAVATALAHMLAGPVSAQTDDTRCSGVSSAALTDQFAVARVVKSAPRVHFVTDAENGRTDCPSPSPACRDKAYLVPDDVVLMLPQPYRGHVCSSYANRRGWETSGWLPAASLMQIAQSRIDEAAWLGTWLRTEAEIAIRRGKQGLAVEGAATYGVHDKGRVESGGVNLGEFDGPLRRSGDLALVADDDIPSFDKAPTDRCVVQMRRIGPYLLVEDNRACGGMNVSFSGLYVRR